MSNNKLTTLHDPGWAQIAKQPLADIQEAILTGSKASGEFPAHLFPLLPTGRKFDRVLDLGCGIGRNFKPLLDRCNQLFAFDIPDMLAACQKHNQLSLAELNRVTFLSHWNHVCNYQYDLVVSCLTLQHVSTIPLLELQLRDLSRLSALLYVSGRSWHDTGRNLYRIINDLDCWQPRRFDHDTTRLMLLERPQETHADVLYSSVEPSQRTRANQLLHNPATTAPELSQPSVPSVPTVSVQQDHKSPTITIAQLFTPNFDHWAFDVLADKLAYAQKHGYGFKFRRGLYTEHADRHPSWHRIPYILELFETADAPDWIFWTDIDSLIMQPALTLERFLPDSSDVHLVVPSQGAGKWRDKPIPDCLCFGQFLLRNSDWSKQLLQTMWQYVDQYENREYRNKESWEQEAINAIRRSNSLDFDKHAHVVNNRLFNSFYGAQYEPGDFIIHFAGVRDDATRTELIRRFRNGSQPQLPTNGTIIEIASRQMLGQLLPYGGIGCEMGVYRGENAFNLYQHARPKEFHLVDFWSNNHNADWTDYREETRKRMLGLPGVTIHDDDVQKILPTFDYEHFDWIYIDTWHTYENVVRDIRLAVPRLKIGGILCGHDFLIDPSDWRTGVCRAVIETIQTGNFQMVALSNETNGDWLLRRLK